MACAPPTAHTAHDGAFSYVVTLFTKPPSKANAPWCAVRRGYLLQCDPSCWARFSPLDAVGRWRDRPGRVQKSAYAHRRGVTNREFATSLGYGYREEKTRESCKQTNKQPQCVFD